MKIKTFISIIILSSLLTGADTFTTADPPMIYIYHFVSYDSTVFVTWNKGNTTKTDTELKTQASLMTENITHYEDFLILDPLNPKAVSAMVTSAVAKFAQMKIAGESIQSRIAGENVMELVKSYAYPNETDYVMVGELNVLQGLFGAQYEIDIKVIDISTQNIISSKSITQTAALLNELRDKIDTLVNDVLVDILSPFLSNIQIYADSTSLDKVRWNTLTMRPTQTMVGGKTVNTSDKDLELMVTNSFWDLAITMPDFAFDEGSRENEFMHLSSGYDRQLSGAFLQGEYVFRVYLKNYEFEDFYEEKIKVEALRGTSFPIKLIPPPPHLLHPPHPLPSLLRQLAIYR